MNTINKKRVKLPYLEHFRHLKKYLIQAGIQMSPDKIFALLYGITAFLDLSILFYILYIIFQYEVDMLYIIIICLVMITLGYILFFLLIWLAFMLILDYLKFKRKTEVEELLPEFLRLVSANHRSGLPLDMSLWKANRARFGILSKEINEIARHTYATGSLAKPLQEFSQKYDSNLLKRIVSNLLEGMKTGSDIATLLDAISMDIIKIRYTRKELATEVEHYMLFITLTVLIISPFMFGLAHKMAGLIEVVQGILASTMPDGSSQTSQMPVNIDFSEGGVDFKKHFDLFVYLMLATNSIISVLLMSTVKYGNVKQELKKIPVFYVVGIIVYMLTKVAMGSFLTL